MLNRRLDLFPLTTTVRETGRGPALTVAGCDLAALAATHGTPLYVYDQASLDMAADAYRATLARRYPGPAGVTFAGKALLMVAAAQWVRRQGFRLDCTGAGELAIAAAAGLPREQILVHGVNKSDEDLDAAVAQAGVIVVDNPTELERLAARAAQGAVLPDLWLRLRPGLAVETHAYRQTGQHDSKFGFSPTETVAAVALAQTHQLPVTGLHFHQGSQFFDPSPIGPALDLALDLALELRGRHGWTPAVLSPGGGWGVAYHEDELPHPDLDAYISFISDRLVAGCAERGLPLPRLQVEPGRSLVARAGVAIYRVGAVKQTPHRRWLLVDGGMADNPRPALYGARYSALPVADPDRSATGPAWIAGPYCESGDVLIEELPMPDMAPGDLLAVPASGAYHINMGSNYNGARKPAVLWLRDGVAHLVQRREAVADLTARDLPLPQERRGLTQSRKEEPEKS
jgi:diaminopimelate decarboxylase